jgi:hypothetical protein
MSALAERAERELNAVLARYAAGEAEVVRAYFAAPRSTAEHADVLRRQMGREIFTADWLERAVGMIPQLERSVDRHAFAELVEQVADEVHHYAVLADLAEWLLGRRLTAEEALEYRVYAHYDPDRPVEQQRNPRLPEANAMIEVVRQRRGEHPPRFVDEVLRLTEGGGGGAFLEATRITGDAFRDRFAAAMKRIVDDELGHGPQRLQRFVAGFVTDEASLALAVALFREFMAQHLRARNEIYGYPLSAERLAAIDRGEIAPWPMFAAAAASPA